MRRYLNSAEAAVHLSIGWISLLHCGGCAHNTILLTMSQPTDRRRYSSQLKRPASIAELTERALDNLWDENKDLKHYLRVAEKCRHDGKEFVRTGDLENAFIQFTRATTLVLEKLPQHRDYYSLLKPPQRQNLRLVRDYQLSGLGVFGCVTLLEEYCFHPTGDIIYDAILGLPHGKNGNFVPCSVMWFGMDEGTGLGAHLSLLTPELSNSFVPCRFSSVMPSNFC